MSRLSDVRASLDFWKEQYEAVAEQRDNAHRSNLADRDLHQTNKRATAAPVLVVAQMLEEKANSLDITNGRSVGRYEALKVEAQKLRALVPTGVVALQGVTFEDAAKRLRDLLA